MYSILIIPFIFYFISLTNSDEQNIFKNMLIEWSKGILIKKKIKKTLKNVVHFIAVLAKMENIQVSVI